MTMKRWKRWLSAMVVAVMIFTACGALAESTAAAGTGGNSEAAASADGTETAAPAGNAEAGSSADGAETASVKQLTLWDLMTFGASALTRDGAVTFVDGACTAEPVRDAADALRVVESMIRLMGGNEETQFRAWSTLTDARGNRYYVFQQMVGETTVPGGAVKIVTDAEGQMLGLTASVEAELPESTEGDGITEQEAEGLVMLTLKENGQETAELIDGRTEKIILPVKKDIDPDETEEEIEDYQCRYVWAVYTTNTGDRKAERPYLAHYVTVDGHYLYNLETILPGDEASVSGYDAAYVFENKEPAEYTGKVTLADGTEQEITVTVMRDTVTGKYCLGDPGRRIAVADCWEFIYNQGNLVLEEREENGGWDDTCLLSLYNYARAWDYYQAIGWNGGDGAGTPILILKEYCNREHQPIDNAAYAGKYYGWQTFLSSSANDYARCLDVLGHEFTHCVTGSMMTYNAYMNDYGAINEAMSDIQGNLCEMMAGDTADTEWLLGENSQAGAIRSMSDPHVYKQPEFTWDVYYIPKVQYPTAINDRGGVHNNSSLLNSIAYRLCAKDGMTPEEARTFWFAVDCAMVPGSDYVQLSALMPWVLKHQGMDGYENALEAAIDATRLRTEEAPDTFDDDRAMVKLTLPDDEIFTDGNWALLIITANWDEINRRVNGILTRTGEYAGMLDEAAALLGIDPALLPTAEEAAADPDHAWEGFEERVLALFEDEDGEEEANALDLAMASGELKKIVRKYFGDTVYAGSVSAGQDGRTIRMITRPGMTIPILYRLEIDGEMHVQSAALAVYIFDGWKDLGSAVASVREFIGEDFFTAEWEDADAAEAADGPETTGETTAETTGETTEEEDGDELSEEVFDLIWSMLGLEETDSAESAEETEQPEEEESVMSTITGFLQTVAGKAVGFAWDLIKEFLFFRIQPGEINVLPAEGVEQVAVMDAETYPFLKDIFEMPASGEEETGEPAAETEPAVTEEPAEETEPAVTEEPAEETEPAAAA